MTTTCITQGAVSDRVVPDAVRTLPASSHMQQPKASPVAQAEQCFTPEKRRLLSGHVVAVTDSDNGEPIADALVEQYAIDPLRTIAGALSAPVLAHIRALLRDGFEAVDLYRDTGYVIDAPTISIADIDLLTQMPGHELLVRASRSWPDLAFQQMLCNYPAILRPLLCYYHPCSFSSRRIATAVSDHSGAFQFPVLLNEDICAQSGYYFVVRRQISRNLFATLYEPMPITWHAYWGQEGIDEEPVRLTTRHPLAVRY